MLFSVLSGKDATLKKVLAQCAANQRHLGMRLRVFVLFQNRLENFGEEFHTCVHTNIYPTRTEIFDIHCF